jgi:hypothetical protein
VLTYHTNNSRDGQNLNETTLTLTNVNSTQFGKVFAFTVDGLVLAQPLYVSNVTIANQGSHNVAYVVTEHDSVYAFDADGKSTTPLWQVSLITSGATTIPSTDVDTPIKTEIGITSTPVIDGSTGTMYVLAGTKENGTHVHRLHALDITSGAEKFGGPVVIQGTVAGTGGGSSGGQIAFDASIHLQRAALLLSKGVVYIAWASHNDVGPFHGWIMGYDAATLHQTAIWNASPDGIQGGIWMSGAGPSADADGNIYVVTGNGTFNVNNGGSSYGDSVVKLSPMLTVLDYLTPFNQDALNTGDIDLGSTAFVLFPDQTGAITHLGVTAGKEGRIYLINRDNMGKFNPTDDSQAVQALPEALGTTANGRNLSTAVFWNNSVFYTGRNDFAKAFTLSNGLLSTTPSSLATHQFGFSNASALSANGTTNAILWTVEGGANVLHAYDATNLANEIYNSMQAGTRDSFGTGTSFTVPLIANGRVYVAGTGKVTAYGLLP